MKPFNLDEYLKNPSRKVVTRDGRNVTIHCTNYNSNFPIVAEIEGAHLSDSFNKEGKFYQISDSENDLFFAPEKKEGWANIFNVDGCNHLDHKIYESKDDAVKEGKCWSFYVATVKIEWEQQKRNLYLAIALIR